MTLTSLLSEIEARLKNATPGPWDYPARTGNLYVCFGEVRDDVILQAVTHRQEVLALARPNMELIAHAPADLARLVEAVRAFDMAAEDILDWIDDDSVADILRAARAQVLGILGKRE